MTLSIGVGLIATAMTPTAQAQTPMCYGRDATIVGTPGKDALEGTSGPDVIVGLDGRDVITGGGGRDLICGGPNPRAFDRNGELLWEGLSGGGGRDRVSGGRGIDEIFGGHGDDLTQGGRGADRLEEQFRGRNIILGGQGSDYLIGGEERDILRGGKGRDFLAGNDGRDSLRGAGGRDVAEYLYEYQAFGSGSNLRSITVNLRVGVATGMGRDRLRSIEDVWTGAGSDVLTGDSNANGFYTGIAVRPGRLDRVRGRGGKDTLSFNDEKVERSCCIGVSIDLRTGDAESGGPGSGFFKTDLRFTSIENVIGSGGRDRIMGNGVPNLFRGMGGDDVIRSRRGKDRLLGGPDRSGGDDTLGGGPGDDKLRGNKGNDRLDGGSGANRNNGGSGTDYCVMPSPAKGARACERP